MASRKGQREAARQERLAAEQRAAAEARRRRLLQLGVGGGLLAVIVVVALIAISQSGGGGSGGSAASITDVDVIAKQLQGIPQRGNILGDPKAKVTVVEYGDPQCPVCKLFSEQVVPTLISGPVRSGEADYEFKPWLIIGPQSKPAAEAALAAGEQGRFFNFIDLFYRNQGAENSGYVTDAFLNAVAKGAGVPNLDAWNSARASSKWSSVLSQINGEATKLGFHGTPSVLVTGPGGRKLFTSIPTEAAIAAAIKAVG